MIQSVSAGEAPPDGREGPAAQRRVPPFTGQVDGPDLARRSGHRPYRAGRRVSNACGLEPSPSLINIIVFLRINQLLVTSTEYFFSYQHKSAPAT
jgi:hypothetical protein